MKLNPNPISLVVRKFSYVNTPILISLLPLAILHSKFRFWRHRNMLKALYFHPELFHFLLKALNRLIYDFSIHWSFVFLNTLIYSLKSSFAYGKSWFSLLSLRFGSSWEYGFGETCFEKSVLEVVLNLNLLFFQLSFESWEWSCCMMILSFVLPWSIPRSAVCLSDLLNDLAKLV